MSKTKKEYIRTTRDIIPDFGPYRLWIKLTDSISTLAFLKSNKENGLFDFYVVLFDMQRSKFIFLDHLLCNIFIFELVILFIPLLLRSRNNFVILSDLINPINKFLSFLFKYIL